MAKPTPSIQYAGPPVPALVGLRKDEQEVLGLLAAAWNAYRQLPGVVPDEVELFRGATHTQQQLIALRVARRVDPTVWRQPGLGG
jgi:hypothetical protein